MEHYLGEKLKKLREASAPLCGKIICADIGIRDEWHPEF